MSALPPHSVVPSSAVYPSTQLLPAHCPRFRRRSRLLLPARSIRVDAGASMSPPSPPPNSMTAKAWRHLYHASQLGSATSAPFSFVHIVYDGADVAGNFSDASKLLTYAKFAYGAGPPTSANAVHSTAHPRSHGGSISMPSLLPSSTYVPQPLHQHLPSHSHLLTLTLY
jgi:hypothetical protein